MLAFSIVQAKQDFPIESRTNVVGMRCLRDTAVELVEGEALLVEKKQAKRRAKSKLARRYAARSEKIVVKAVASIAAHRELLMRLRGTGDTTD
jgi:hypothetical protein